MVFYTWTATGHFNAFLCERRISRSYDGESNMALVPLKDVSRVAGVIEHLCNSHIDRPAIIQRDRTVDNLE